MKRFVWIGAALVIVALLVTAETAIITSASGYDKKEEVVFTNANIPGNTLITADMLEIRKTGGSSVHPDAVKNAGEALGKRTSTDLVKGEMLLKARLSSDSRKIAKAEDKNNRLFSVELKTDQANAWQFSDRQFVDIIYVPNQGEKGEQTPRAEGVTDAAPVSSGIRIMKNVRVAGLVDEDGRLLDSSDSKKTPRYVSFEVTQEQAIFLAYAKSNGRLELSCIPEE
jgi:Flp pilus assembly protein CpaB